MIASGTANRPHRFHGNRQDAPSGRLLAERLGRRFVDLDDAIAAEAGRSDRRDLSREGRGGFPPPASRGAAPACSAEPDTVIATGGGAACREPNLTLMLDAATVVALSATPDEVLRRTGGDSGRPLLDGAADPLAAARELLARSVSRSTPRAHVRDRHGGEATRRGRDRGARGAYEGEGVVMKWGERAFVGGGVERAGRRLAGCTDCQPIAHRPAGPGSGDECVVADDAGGGRPVSSPASSTSALDQLYSYKLFPLVQNNLLPGAVSADVEPNRVSDHGRADQDRASARRRRSRLRADCAAEFDHPSQSSISPGATRAVRVEAIRACHAALFQELFRSGALNPDGRARASISGSSSGSRGGTAAPRSCPSPSSSRFGSATAACRPASGGPFSLVQLPDDSAL